MSDDTLLLGAVAYDAKVVPIWEGFKAWFAQRGLAFDFVLYSNYERQVCAHLDGHVHVAWNSPLAWLQSVRAGAKRGRKAEAIAMRDTDQDLTSLVLVRADSPLRELRDLKGKRVGVGAKDSPQATLIPLVSIAEAGVDSGADFDVVMHDVLVGKHGDHIGGERDAARALMASGVDAACVIDGNHILFAREGVLPADSVRVLHRTGAYDHCNFTVFDDAPRESVAKFRELLLSMRYDDPVVRPLLDMEGLKEWKPGRTSGYALLERACDRSGELDAWVQGLG
ncbi:MAG: PhnD/SsuA/transferrin family substrate-binding protein [Polyangiaceae bacterium]